MSASILSQKVQERNADPDDNAQEHVLIEVYCETIQAIYLLPFENHITHFTSDSLHVLAGDLGQMLARITAMRFKGSVALEMLSSVDGVVENLALARNRLYEAAQCFGDVDLGVLAQTEHITRKIWECQQYLEAALKLFRDDSDE
jgi:hypothetical protein